MTRSAESSRPFPGSFAAVERCEGEANEPRVFSTFTPKTIKLANIDDRLTSRSNRNRDDAGAGPDA